MGVAVEASLTRPVTVFIVTSTVVRVERTDAVAGCCA
jgi:hypothetical protein